MGETRIVVVDKQPIFRAGLVSSIDRFGQLSVSGVADNAHDAIGIIRKNRPSVAVVSVSLPGVNGAILASAIPELHADCRVVLVVHHRAFDEVHRRFESSYIRVVRANVQPDRLRRTILDLANSFIPTEVPKPSLSARDIEILDCVVLGMSNRDIAIRLDLPRRAVRDHLERLLGTLNASDRVDALLKVVEDGWTSSVNSKPWLN